MLKSNTTRNAKEMLFKMCEIVCRIINRQMNLNLLDREAVTSFVINTTILLDIPPKLLRR